MIRLSSTLDKLFIVEIVQSRLSLSNKINLHTLPLEFIIRDCHLFVFFNRLQIGSMGQLSLFNPVRNTLSRLLARHLFTFSTIHWIMRKMQTVHLGLQSNKRIKDGPTPLFFPLSRRESFFFGIKWMRRRVVGVVHHVPELFIKNAWYIFIRSEAIAERISI